MSARKLGRLAGLVLALVAALGGIGLASHAQSATGGPSKISTAIHELNFEIIWS
jgi:hypothetical protein